MEGATIIIRYQKAKWQVVAPRRSPCSGITTLTPGQPERPVLSYWRPAPNDLLRMWPVSKRVNVSGRGDDDPNLIEPVKDEAIATC